MSKKNAVAWIESLVEARYELHRTDEHGNRWEVWNEVENFFGDWVTEIARS